MNWLWNLDSSRRILIIPLLLSLLAVAGVLILAQPAGSAPGEAVVSFSAPGGYYSDGLRLRLSSAASHRAILYTLDGRSPAIDSLRYTAPLTFPATEPAVVVVRARVLKEDGQLGPVRSASYAINVPAALPILSLITDPGNLWPEEDGIYANPLQKGIAWERPVHVTYINENRRGGFQVDAGLRIHGGFTRTYDKKAFRLYFRDEYGQRWLEYPLFPDDDLHRFKRLVVHNGGQDSPTPQRNWSLMRNQLVARLAAEIDGYATRSRPVLLFLNGEPWGIYQVRERIDERFLATRYGVPAAEILEAPELSENRRRTDTPRAHWDNLQAFLETHDLSDPSHYATVAAQVDIDNFIDYTLLQIYSANIDWPHRNMIQFRPATPGGRWHWIFWDSDFSFGLLPYSSVERNMVAQALVPDHPNTGGGDTLLLRRLLQNSGFRHRFLRRAADLLNTTLAPANVSGHIEALAAELRPDIWYEAGRWHSAADWDHTIAEMHAFAEARPAIVRRRLMEELGAPGTAVLTILPPPDGEGYVALNGRLLPTLPYSGAHFLETSLAITAVPAPGYQFAGWENRPDAVTRTVTLPLDGDVALTPRFAPLPEGQPRPGDVAIIAAGYEGTVFPPTASAPDEAIDGSWVRLQVQKAEGVDLRGWRISDNDSLTAGDEGSLILPDHPALARVPWRVQLLIVAASSLENDAHFPADDFNPADGQMLLYLGNGRLRAAADRWFNLGKNDTIVLLAPGATDAYADDPAIAIMQLGAGETAVSPISFGLPPTVVSEQNP